MTRTNSLPEKYQKQVDEKLQKNKGTKTKLVIPGKLPRMNKIVDKSKAHWGKYKKLKKEADDKVAWYATQQKIKFFEAVKLRITYYTKNKRHDPDNILSSKKFIMDGLVNAGILENDGWKQVKGFKEKWKVDKEKPRIEIEFKEVKN
jgi:hypothetical protein